MPTFIPGLDLSESFYQDVVRPLLAESFPKLRHSAALIGPGSEVLGFDTPQSRDHDWGPRMLLFLSAPDYVQLKDPLDALLSTRLPHTFRGYPTHFGPPDHEGVRLLENITSGPIQHRVQIHTLDNYFEDYLGVDPRQELTPQDWLVTSEQKLRTITAGRIFHDDLGLERIRATLDYYPEDIWRYLMASEWTKIAQEEPFVGRCGDVGDELGSRLIAARLVQYLMHLSFLLEREYAPYSKWFGHAFAQLKGASALGPIFQRVLAAADWKTREAHLSAAYELLAARHNALHITPALPDKVSPFFARPYRVIHADVFATALCESIADPQVRTLPPIGSVNQFIDSTDVLSNTGLAQRLGVLFA